MPYLQGTFEERCHTTGAPGHLSFFTASLSILFLSMNIPGNLLLILAVAFDPHKNLRSPFNYLMSNLAVADLITGLISEPLSVNYHIKEGLYSRLSIEEIRVFHMSYFISCTASILSLASLAIERYLAIRNPHTYRNKLTGKRIFLTVISIWCIALSLPFVYFEVGFITCAFILANTTVFLAVGIMSFTYGLMIWKFKTETSRFQSVATSASEMDNSKRGCLLKTCRHDHSSHHNNTNRQENTSLHDNTSPHDNTNHRANTRCHDNSNRHDKTVRMEAKITKMFLVVMAAVLGCYGPSAILTYVMSFCESCTCESLHWFRDLQSLFVLMNSSVNFFCYGLRSPRFRQAFAAILRLPNRRRLAGNAGSMSTPSSESQPMRTVYNQKLCTSV